MFPVALHAQDLQKLLERSISYPDSSAVWNEIARLYEYQGVYDSAMHFAKIAIEKDPDNLDAIGQSMFINMVLEQYESCKADARHILSVVPEDLAAIYCLAYSLMESGDYDGSISQIQAGIELAPKLAAFYSLMSRVLTRKGSFVESGMFISRALDLAPNEAGQLFYQGRKCYSGHNTFIRPAGRYLATKVQVNRFL